jgi:lantibiotic modifying enzyme
MNTDSLKYIQVIENIHQELMISELSANIGLHAGTSGLALFLAYYDRIILRKNEISTRLMDILEHNIKQIDSGNRLHTICNGISGFGWLCEHLRKLKMLNQEDIKFLDDLDPFLYRQMITDIRTENYDYLHGALGVGTYFLSRCDKEETAQYLDDLLTELENSAIPCENGAVKWLSVLDHETGEKGFNISLSHGMSSIAAFLLRLYLLNFETERVSRLLSQTITYIIDQITYAEGSISYFPSYSKENSSGYYYSRLGWCYGDLGIAHVLWQAAVALNNKDWQNTALKVLHHNTNRRNLLENGIRDAGLCHGSAGVAHIFRSLYLNTRIPEFRDTADYWLNITKQMAKYTDGLAGFKAWRTEKFGGDVKSDTLLEGIAGIGLVLLSLLKTDEMKWDECFMLS